MAKRPWKDVALLASMGVILNKGDRVVSHELKRSSEVLIRVSGREPRSLIFKTYFSLLPPSHLFSMTFSQHLSPKSTPPPATSPPIRKQFSSFKSHRIRRPLEQYCAIWTFDLWFTRHSTNPTTLTKLLTFSALNTSRNSNFTLELLW